MVKRGIIVLITALFAIFALSFVSATVKVSTPANSLYNVGDKFSISFTLSETSDTNDFFTASLVCDNSTNIIFKSPYSVLANTDQTITINAILDSKVIGNLQGNCYVLGSYGDEEILSSNFIISPEIKVDVSFVKDSVNPGDSLSVSGTATKLNGELLKGQVEVSVPELKFDQITNVSSGSFSLSIPIPDDNAPGNYTLNTIAYSRDASGNIINQGSLSKTFFVNQVVKTMDLVVSPAQIDPGSDLTYTASLKDQIGNPVTGLSIKITIISPSNSTVYKTLNVNSGDENKLTLESNSTAGIWEFKSEFNGLSGSKLLTVNKLEKLSYSIANGTLTVINVGNIPYNSSVSIKIGNVTRDLNVSLGFGAIKQYKLSAPKGDYEISVNDNAGLSSLGSSFLTGRAISVQDLQGLSNNSSVVIIGWIILIIIIALIVYQLYRYNKKKKSLGSTSTSAPIKVVSASSVGASMISNPTNQGDKQECAVLILKIRNLNVIRQSDSNAMETINVALAKARENRFSTFEQNEVRAILIPKSALRDKELSAVTVKLVKDIDDLITEHNKKYSQKIEYGLGANIGELIVEKKDGKYKFHPLGNTIQLARKVADAARNTALISETVRTRAMKNIKVEKVGDYYSITSVLDREAHSEFIRKFMDRNRSSFGKK